jgi:hypothetical protein
MGKKSRWIPGERAMEIMGGIVKAAGKSTGKTTKKGKTSSSGTGGTKGIGDSLMGAATGLAGGAGGLLGSAIGAGAGLAGGAGTALGTAGGVLAGLGGGVTAGVTAGLTNLIEEVNSAAEEAAAHGASVVDFADVVTSVIDKYIPRTSGEKTATRIALSAIDQLSGAKASDLREALTAIKNKKVDPEELVEYIERRLTTRAFKEVFEELADGWSSDTKAEFASPKVFQIDSNKADVADCVVSAALLNQPDLADSIRAENMPETTFQDLLENRRIVEQYPPAGTELGPPYLVLVAVEHEDVAGAEDVVEGILGKLVEYQGFMLPSVAVAKLRAGTTLPGFKKPEFSGALRTKATKRIIR